MLCYFFIFFFFFFQAEDGIRDGRVTGVQTCALSICPEALARAALALGGVGKRLGAVKFAVQGHRLAQGGAGEIGRASCRERGWGWGGGGGVEENEGDEVGRRIGKQKRAEERGGALGE